MKSKGVSANGSGKAYRDNRRCPIARRLTAARCRNPHAGRIAPHVEIWTDDDLHVEQTKVRADNITLARAAYDAAVHMHPTKIVRLRDRTRVVREHKPQT
jgi:hypothetical protein